MIKSVDFALRHTIPGMPIECIMVLSLDGIVTFMNPEGLTLFEAPSAADVIGKSLVDLWPADERPKIAAALREAAGGDAAVIEGLCPTFQGRPRYCEMSFYLVNQGVAVGSEIIGVTREIPAPRDISLPRSGKP